MEKKENICAELVFLTTQNLVQDSCAIKAPKSDKQDNCKQCKHRTDTRSDYPSAKKGENMNPEHRSL